MPGNKRSPMPHRLPGPLRPVSVAVAFVLTLGAWCPTDSFAAKKPAAEKAGDWPEITAAEKALTKVEQDPEADAIVLINDRSGKIVPTTSGQWVNQLDYHHRFKVLNERGKRYADVHLGTNKYSSIKDLRARTIKTDGTIVPVAPEEIFEKVVLQVGKYTLNELVFKFPAVEPGTIL